MRCPPDPLTSDVHGDRLRFVDDLVSPGEIREALPVTPAIARLVERTRHEIHEILGGADPRLLVVVGPCSLHDARAALAYGEWLLDMRARFAGRLLLVMRAYLEKPRTTLGWKGLINDPELDGSFRINEGLRLARTILRDLNTLGVPTASEFIDVVTPHYLADLVSWSAVGARTAESPLHRQMASGLPCPVGIKNGTDGNMTIATNAIVAARSSHHLLALSETGRPAIVATSGNPDSHIVLRGGTTANHDSASVEAAVRLLERRGLPPRLMIDCGHGNARAGYPQQLDTARDIRAQIRAGSPHIFGVMVESNLVAGNQPLTAPEALVFGQSITDPCIGLDDTAALLATLAGERD